MRVLYHTLHSCGHSVYWTHREAAMLCSAWACPWCGGQTGKVKEGIEHSNVLRIGDDDHIVRALQADGRVPQLPGTKEDEEIGIQHMTGDVCCNSGSNT